MYISSECIATSFLGLLEESCGRKRKSEGKKGMRESFPSFFLAILLILVLPSYILVFRPERNRREFPIFVFSLRFRPGKQAGENNKNNSSPYVFSPYHFFLSVVRDKYGCAGGASQSLSSHENCVFQTCYTYFSSRKSWKNLQKKTDRSHEPECTSKPRRQECFVGIYPRQAKPGIVNTL